MKRLLVVVLVLFVLPLHFSWAIAASYCQHESGEPAQHFGHHSHQHEASQDGSNDAGTPPFPFQVHSDCSICQLSCTAATVSVPPAAVSAPEIFAVPDPPDAFASIFPEGPERPKWTSVA